MQACAGVGRGTQACAGVRRDVRGCAGMREGTEPDVHMAVHSVHNKVFLVQRDLTSKQEEKQDFFQCS